MNHPTVVVRVARALAALGAILILVSPAGAETAKPVHLLCESLTTPLGVDTRQPVLSWQLRDPAPGAKQSAYEIQVASSEALLRSGRADLWDSGKVESEDSLHARYAGKPLEPSTRYYWRVRTWGRDGRAYPPGDTSWWETGLLDTRNWTAQWIGYDEPELHALRGARAQWITNAETENPVAAGDTRHQFRFRFDLEKPVARGLLYVTGQDNPAAWVNGQQVLEAQPFPPWKQMPWKTYTVRDVTRELRTGKNLLAVEVLRYREEPRRGNRDDAQTPMSATLYLEQADGTAAVFASGGEGWRATLGAGPGWQAPEFDDASWKAPVAYVPPPDSFEVRELGDPWPTGAVKSLRRTFDVAKTVASARMYATALGAYKLSINGREVGDQVLSPGWTDFRQRLIYQAYDVTGSVKKGKNAIAALLAPGWYATPLEWLRQGNNYGKTPPALRAALRLRFDDGSVEWVATDGSWKAAVSPIVSAEIYDGETYDARKFEPGWDQAGFDDAGWKPVEVVRPAEPELVWQFFPPIREHQVLEAKAVSSPAPEVYIFDFGQNLSGVPRLRARGPAGTDVRLRFAEVLNPDGTLYVDNLRTAKATDHFLLSGKGAEEFQPKFTFHGFRYVEVTGFPGKPGPGDVRAVVLYTDAPFTATLSTGSAMVNQLWSNILWGQRSNFVGVPTDCPQRDERLGWSADAQVFWRAAAYNMDLAAFSRKYAGDLRGTQSGAGMYGIYAPGTSSPHPGHGTGWSDAGVIVPWTSWLQTGDRKVLEENWTAMERYLAAIEAANPDYLWKNNYGIAFADWLAPEGVTPVDLIATAYWAYGATQMQQMAHALGRSDDETRYGRLFQRIREAFVRAYVKPDGFVGGVPPPPVFASGTETKLPDRPVETQTGYVLALHMNLLPEELRPVVGQRLVDRITANGGRLGTGFLGTPYLLGALTDTGHADVAYRLLLSTDYPSWGYMVEHGATTMWERWNGDQMRNDPGMNSYNHYAYGAVADWLYRYAAGIDAAPGDPGFHTVLLHPNFEARLGRLALSYDSSYGTIRSAWSVTGKTVTWEVTLPANSEGRLAAAAGEAWKLDGKPLAENTKVRPAGRDGNRSLFALPAGSYRFEATLP